MVLRKRMPARRRRVVRRRRLGRKRLGLKKIMNPLRDSARVVEVFSTTDLSGGAPGEIQKFTLSQFPRALAVSKNFRFYRATKVELEFIPYANVFPAGQSFPELYYQYDPTAILINDEPTLASMQGRGVLPVKWTQPIKRFYTPAVLRHENLITQMYKASDGETYYLNDAQPVSATPVKWKWYMTEQTFQPSVMPANGATTLTQVGPARDPTNLVYGASSYFINSPLANANAVGRLLIRVHWQFKQPLVLNTTPNIDISGNNIHLQV